MRIDALFEEEPWVEGTLFLAGFLSFLFFGWIYADQVEREHPVRHWHDAIAGTRVISQPGRLRIELGRLAVSLMVWLDKSIDEHTPD